MRYLKLSFQALCVSALVLGCDADSSNDAKDAGTDGGGGGGESHNGIAADDLETVCEHYEFGPSLPLTASADPAGELPEIEPHHRAEVTLPGAGEAHAGYIGLTLADHGEMVLLADPGVPVVLETSAGQATEPEAEGVSGPACAIKTDGQVFAYHLEPGEYRIHLGPTASELVKLSMHLPGGEEGHEHEHAAVPDEFADLPNPFAADPAAAAAEGAPIFAANCERCHGADGHGGGPDGAALMPPPGDVAQDEHADKPNYLYWRITTGGATDFELEAGETSSMPAFDDTLSDEDRWRVVNYIIETLIGH